jgi:hypothetical protein
LISWCIPIDQLIDQLEFVDQLVYSPWQLKQWFNRIIGIRATILRRADGQKAGLAAKA